ncbi:hypothetical protein [Cellulomonas sp. ATA003]|uniref:hypothetical protein n=1 Tax=Cellulomonas sp. ATA003 TaxID=3073064 RepID=UPI002872DDBF|nr:hypothetical protein [Cellulomonas sp. ATA003]WNB85071.1 hypothetical protein REH70_15575 [Cellulomonas sp. ATA003]
MLFALNYGWLPLAIVCALLVGAIVLTVTRRATAPTIALAAQVPAVMTVALITQYGMFLWFVAGLAVVSQIQRRAALAPSAHPATAVGVSAPASDSRTASPVRAVRGERATGAEVARAAV